MSGVLTLPDTVKCITLDNGLTIILGEDRSAPVVSAQVWCQTGSIHEGPWLGSGISHVLEHMLFKGTTTRGLGRIDQEVQEAGGYLNAFTSFDRTVYFINVPNSGRGVAVDILADIVQNAQLPDDELAKEKQVILREMDMNQDDPARRSSRRLFETAYTVSPYRLAVIGYPDVFHALKPADVRSYYRDRYLPNNLFMVVVGDIHPTEIECQIREAFGAARFRPLAPIFIPEDPPQMSERQVLEDAPIELAHFHYGWHIPSLRHPDVPVLDVLATLLGAGRSSRLYEQVRERKGCVHSIDAWTYSPGAPGLIGLSAVAELDRFEGACQAMLDEVQRIREERVTEEELGKAVKQFTAATLATRKTMQGRAQDLGGNWMAARDLNFSERYLAAVKAITPADLQRVARHYLSAENRTLYALLPQRIHNPTIASIPVVADSPIERVLLPNGLRLLVKEDHRLPFVEFRAVFKGGLLSDSEATNGSALLMAKMLLKGTHRYAAADIARHMESVGGHIDTYSGHNSFGVCAEVLRDDFRLGLDMVLDVLRNPSFPSDALELEKTMQLASIKALRDQILHVGSCLLRRTLFGATGYGLEVNGSEESVPGIQTYHLQALHRHGLAPQNGVLAIFGDIKADEVRDSLTALTRDWCGSALTSLNPPVSPNANKNCHVTEHLDKNQAVVLIGFPGATLFDPDRHALDVLQESCSDLGSRLFLRIRDQLGLAYYVGAQNVLGLYPGYFVFYAGTSPDNAVIVENEMLREIELLRNEGLTASELNRSKSKLIGHRKIARQDIGDHAMRTALDELYGLGYDYSDSEDRRLEGITLEEVRAAARRIFRLDCSVIATVKPKSEGKPEIRA